MTMAKWNCICSKCGAAFEKEVQVTENFLLTLEMKPDNIHFMAQCPECGECFPLDEVPTLQHYI